MIKVGWPCGVAAEQVDIKALLEDATLIAIQIYISVKQERMESIVSRL